MPFTASDICKILLAIILPPLGVFLERGCNADFLINILLTVLGYHPRAVHYFQVLASPARIIINNINSSSNNSNNNNNNNNNNRRPCYGKGKRQLYTTSRYPSLISQPASHDIKTSPLLPSAIHFV
ncbi:hypothetical protein IAQ61_007543, partial [Plenodomus lingam]|uniref:uncharacterized protein n=1 Tax=Leptosphaeria maculans TaxID=5022 RepID=UPI0033226004